MDVRVVEIAVLPDTHIGMAQSKQILKDFKRLYPSIERWLREFGSMAEAYGRGAVVLGGDFVPPEERE